MISLSTNMLTTRYAWVAVLGSFYLMPKPFQNYPYFLGLILIYFVNYKNLKKIFDAKLVVIFILVLILISLSALVRGDFFYVFSKDIWLPFNVAFFIGGVILIARNDYQFVVTSTFHVATIAAVFGIVMWSMLYFENDMAARLHIWGRGYNPIHAGSLLATGIISGLSLSCNKKPYWLIELSVLHVAMVLTASRGVLVSYLIAVVFYTIFLSRGKSSGRTLFILSILSWSLVTALVVFERFYGPLICRHIKNLCRTEDLRIEFLPIVFSYIQENLWLGNGLSFRLIEASGYHAHNGIIGLTLALGIIGLTLFLLLFWLVVSREAIADCDEGWSKVRFVQISLIFGFAYMGSDLASPYAFVRNHYLFLWLPLAIILGQKTTRDERYRRAYMSAKNQLSNERKS